MARPRAAGSLHYRHLGLRQLSLRSGQCEVTSEQGAQTGGRGSTASAYSGEVGLSTQMQTGSGNGLHVSFSSSEGLGVWAGELCGVSEAT